MVNERVQMSMRIKLPWEEEKKREPIPSKLKKEKMYKRIKCNWCRKQPAQEIHHIDENPRNNKPDNLIALCGTCHNRATYGKITKEQLRKRLGITKKPKKRAAKKRKTKRKRARTPLERLTKQLKKDFPS